MNSSGSPRLALLIGGVLPIVGVLSLSVAVSAPTGAAADSSEMATSLRLSPTQYRQTIADVFGRSIKIDGRFEPEQRDQGLLAIGARTANIGDNGLENFVNI